VHLLAHYIQRNLADYEEKYLTPDGKAKAEPTRRKTNKLKDMSSLNAELRRQADDEVQIVRELNTEEEQKILEQSTRLFAERSVEITPEENIQTR
jgi:hypothetical protein